MNRLRPAIGAVLAVAVLALTGCMANPDVSGVRDGLDAIDGVNGVEVFVEHPGTPWTTIIVANLYVGAATQDDIVAVVEAAIPVLADAPDVARHRVSLTFIDGAIADFPNGAQLPDKILVARDSYLRLGLEPELGEAIGLTPEDIRTLMQEDR
jgi:hypothetical protein